MNTKTKLTCIAQTLAMMLMPLSLISCSDDDKGTTVPTSIPESFRELSFGAEAAERKISVHSSAVVEMTTDADWLTLTRLQTESEQVRPFTVSCTANTTADVRRAEIAVTASDGFEGTISVEQAAGNTLQFVGTPLESISVGAAGGTVAFSVRANAEPRLALDATWVTADAPRAEADVYTYSLAVAANYVASERTATATLTNGVAKLTFSITQQAAASEASTTMSTAKELAAKIVACINIGNTLEAPGGETSWGNPQISADYIAGLRTLGFNAVRIPCAWHSHLSDASAYTIDAAWMARVTEVVDMCMAHGMYVILNAHWDGGWLEDNIFDASKQEAITAEQRALWTQIAANFADRDEHLLFAGCNEPGVNETSSGGKKWDAEAVARLLAYEQTFVDAVRATGGNNAKRCLVVQGLGTDISNTYDMMNTLPTDAEAGRLMVEVHYYEPYPFALMETDASWGKVFWYWGEGNHKEGSAHNATWGEESWVTDQFGKMKSKFVDKGYPVIIGEYAARIQTAAGRSDTTEEFDAELHNRSRAYFNQVVTREAKNNGCVPCYWETGGDIDRKTGTAKCAYAIDGIMLGASEGVYPF